MRPSRCYPWRPWNHPHYDPKAHWSIVLQVHGVSVYLNPQESVFMAITVSLGHTVGMAIVFLDQNGNKMLTTPVPDVAPVWTQTTPATETLTVAPDGLTSVATPVAAGSDTISLSVTVGGAAFNASLDVTVQAAAQVLTSVAIVPTVS